MHSKSAVVLPIVNESTYSVVIVGLNPHRPYDEAYRVFLQLLGRQLATGLAIVCSYEQAIAREQELLTLDRFKSTLYSNVSHELRYAVTSVSVHRADHRPGRTPLTLILGPLSDLVEQATELAPEHLASLKLMLRNANRLRKLIGTFLDFSRLEQGRTQVSRSLLLHRTPR